MTPMSKRSPTLKKDARAVLRKRLLGIACFFVLFGAALGTRLFFLQVINHEKLVALSKKQYESTKKIVFGRGTIFDRNQNELAMNVEVESVYITPKKVKDKQHTARILADHLDVSRKEILKNLTSKKHFAWVKRKGNLREIQKLQRLGLPGVGFIAEQKRFYPKRELAANVTGFVGMDNEGFAGVEHYHHSTLKGTTVLKVIEKDARGRNIRSISAIGRPKTKSGDVVLTIDEVIQFIAEHHLKKQVEKFQADSGMAIVMEPYTGGIYAMANVPQFNPNKYQAYIKDNRRNRIISSNREKGG